MSRVLTTEQQATLRRLCGVFEGKRFVLIGANAIACWVSPDHLRPTKDLDLQISCELDEARHVLSHAEGWRQLKDHAWESPDGVKVDIVPASDDLRARGSVTFPGGSEMSLVGSQQAFETAVHRSDLVPGTTVPVAPLHVLVLLKMVSVRENPPARLAKDAPDLVDVLRTSKPTEWPWEDMPENVDPEFWGAWLLGRDLGRLLNESPTEHDEVSRFLDDVLLRSGRHDAHDRMLAHLDRRGDDGDHDALGEWLRDLWQAYERGFLLD